MKQQLTSGKFGGADKASWPCFLVALCGLVCIILALLIAPPRHGKAGYMAAIIDKHRLLERTSGKRVLLVGGSNLAFGTDSPQLERELGLPVVNMGLHAGLGLRYMLDEVKPFLSKDDIVIVVPEYEQFGGLSEGYVQQHMQVLEASPDRFGNLLDRRRAFMIAKGLSGFLKKKLAWYKNQVFSCYSNIRMHGKCQHEHLLDTIPCPPYARSAYNDKGDVVAHLDMPSPGIATQVVSIPRCADNNSIQALADFYRFSERKGVNAFLCFPAIPRSKFDNQKAACDALYASLKELLDIPILSKPDKYVLPDECFFDTCYHLTRRGIYLRMPMMAADLKHALNRQTALNCKGILSQ